MLQSRALAANADALKNVDRRIGEEACSCACLETPSEEEHHEGEERSASRSDIGAYGGDVCVKRIGMGEPAGEPLSGRAAGSVRPGLILRRRRTQGHEIRCRSGCG